MLRPVPDYRDIKDISRKTHSDDEEERRRCLLCGAFLRADNPRDFCDCHPDEKVERWKSEHRRTIEISTDVLTLIEQRDAERIISAVAEAYGIRKKALVSFDRSPEFTLPRWLAIYLIREDLKIFFHTIGKYFNRSGETIKRDCTEIRKRIREDQELKKKVREIRSRYRPFLQTVS